MDGVGDCEVPLRAGKPQIWIKVKNLFWLAVTVLDLILFHLLILFHSSLLHVLSVCVVYSICFLQDCIGFSPCTAILVVVSWDSRNICHRTRGAKTLDSTLSPGSGIHTIWLFPGQLLNRWLAWFLSAAALLTLRAKKRWQHGRMYATRLFRWSKQHAVYKEHCDRDPQPKPLTQCSLPQFTVQI